MNTTKKHARSVDVDLKTKKMNKTKAEKKEEAKSFEDDEENIVETHTNQNNDIKLGQGSSMSTKKVHLNPKQVKQRIKELENTVKTLEGSENAKKRKRMYQQLAKLQKALENPEENIIDPDEEFQKRQVDKEKRIAKKLQKAEDTKKEKQRERNRGKHAICIICKNIGHLAVNCNQAKQDPSTLQELTQSICFNCGKGDHRLKDCPKPRGNLLAFATCFHCKGKGHLSRDCPQNPEGIYHKGGSCFECGSKRHLAKECPHRGTRVVETVENNNIKDNKTKNKDKNKNKVKEQEDEDYQNDDDGNGEYDAPDGDEYAEDGGDEQIFSDDE